jgi:protein-L-isoaspartate(D-aspartate) O-methyltransferase
MKGRLMTCIGDGRFSTEDLFETQVPMLKNPRHSANYQF